MAVQIVWTKQAEKGDDRIVNYIAENWSESEVVNSVSDTDRFFEILKLHPEILQRTSAHKNVYRGPINRLTILTYRVKLNKNQIQLINIRGARQKPSKLDPPF